MDISTSFMWIIILTKLLNVVMMRNSEVMLGQTLNNSVELCNLLRHILKKSLNLLKRI
jgi:hypothetical protein